MVATGGASRRRSSRPSTRTAHKGRASIKCGWGPPPGRGAAGRTGQEVAWGEKDKWWHETVEQASPEHQAQPFDSEHPLFILYTSGTTGKPKGILHTTGGFLAQTSYTQWSVFDLKPE